MSYESQGKVRSLRLEEDSLIRTLLENVRGEERYDPELERALVNDMGDGGMGSIQFAGDEGRTLGRRLVEAECVDSDGVPVNIALNADRSGRLYELDIWKVDFAPLREYPACERLTIRA